MVFLGSGIDEPHPTGSAATTFNTSLYFFYMNFFNAYLTVPLIKLGLSVTHCFQSVTGILPMMLERDCLFISILRRPYVLGTCDIGTQEGVKLPNSHVVKCLVPSTVDDQLQRFCNCRLLIFPIMSLTFEQMHFSLILFANSVSPIIPVSPPIC